MEKKLFKTQVSRRTFMEQCGWVAAASALSPMAILGEEERHVGDSHFAATRSFGSGHFGSWITDEFGLPAFHYTCDQTTDPKAITTIDNPFRSPTDQTHQVGNDRLVAASSNYGYVQVRQDEGSPKFLNDFSPERGQYGGGIGYLTDGTNVLSTFFDGKSESFDRIFGAGYLRKKVAGAGYAVDHVIFAPYGDDPVLVSEVTIANHSHATVELRWVEYWGCQAYQFSFRSQMQANVAGATYTATELRRKFGDRFGHTFHRVEGEIGLLETKHFLGRTEEDRRLWQAVKDAMAANAGHGGLASAEGLEGTDGMEDLHPPATFLVSLDGQAQGFATDGKAFFGEGGVARPAGLSRALGAEPGGHLSGHGPESVMLLERRITLKPGESETLRFLYGYLPKGFELTSLVDRYRAAGTGLLARSSRRWKEGGLHFGADSEPWIERELTWSSYYLRSNLTYDDAFEEHILTQGSIYQYIMGLQGAARDPLQHVLPFLFSDPAIVKEILRYTLKEVREDGSIPYAIVGHGVPMPTAQDDSSDQALWLLWVACEYVLATRDVAFLEEEVSRYGDENAADKASVRSLLARCYRYLIEEVGTGPHGLMRMLMDDWLDALVFQRVPPELRMEYVKVGESVLNSAMASYVFVRYASVLRSVKGEPELIADAQQKAEEHRQAVRAQWTGKWFRRAWLGPHLGWVGEDSIWIGPQSWALLGGAATPEQREKLGRSLDELLRRPSPIGAMRWSPASDKDKKVPLGAKPRVCASLNGTLTWALATLDGKMAWDEWKKNTLATHAEAYPDLWYGTWSGPDVYNGIQQADPGQTPGTSYPVMNMHPHAWPLYTAAMVLGLEFTLEGATLRPALPLETYRFVSPLFGLEKTTRGYEGWYAPSGGDGEWTIALHLPEVEWERFARVRVNGVTTPAERRADGAIEIRGRGAAGKPLRWSVTA